MNLTFSQSKNSNQSSQSNQSNNLFIKLTTVVLLLTSMFLAKGQQGTEYVSTKTVTGSLQKNIVYTQNVRILPPSGGGSTTISSTNGTYFISPYATNPPPANASNYNYVRTETPKVPVSSPVDLTNLSELNKITTYAYSDGVGRAKQQVTASVGPNHEDMVQHYQYNASTGRQDNSFLPFAANESDPGAFKTDPNGPSGGLPTFYNGTNGIPNDSKFYTETTWDPQGRVKNSLGVGNAWHAADKRSRNVYKLNDPDPMEDGDIANWYIEAGVPKSNLYAKNEVRITIVTDPQNQKVRQVVDSRGLSVTTQIYDGTRWIGSYNVYDDYGRLRFIMPPMITKDVGIGSTLNPTAAQIENLTYQFKYDALGRLIEEKAPGAGWTEHVYDPWDRLVLSRKPGQQFDGVDSWTFFKYDALNRLVVTGELKTDLTRTELQSRANTSTDADRYETLSSANVDYTHNNSFPDLTNPDYANHEVLTINYFDNYSFISWAGWDAEGHNFSMVNPSGFTGIQSDSVIDLPTGSKVKLLNGEGKWLNSVIYYDDKLRVIQTITENHLEGLDRLTNELDWKGELQKNMVQHTGTQTVDILSEYEYARNADLLKTYQTINEPGNPGDRILVAEYKYNALGEPVEKNLHSRDGISFLQSVDFSYNIKGWLTAINDADLADGEGDLFGMKFNYTTPTTIIAGPPNKYMDARYDGLISSVEWKASNVTPSVTPLDGPLAGTKTIYGFQYDGRNRLISANYGTRSGDLWAGGAEEYNVVIPEYDDNGNIKELRRNSEGAQIDNLTYTYPVNSNQLQSVTDTSPNEGGFEDYYTGPTDYGYDPNGSGNMVSDMNKEITDIEYNHLQLIDRIAFFDLTELRYTYDAAGNRLSKAVFDPDGNQLAKVDYVGLIEYLDDEINQVFINEGRAYRQNDKYHYEYFLTDHQGNNRVAFGELPERNIYVADMEGGEKDSYFAFPIPDVRVATNNHTFGGSKSAALNGPVEAVGPARVLNIAPGDEVDLEVWAKYDLGQTWDNSRVVGGIISDIGDAFGVAYTGGGTETAATSLQNILGAPAGTMYAGDNNPEGAPEAYLQYLFFDENYVFQESNSGFIPVTTDSDGKYAKLSKPTLTYDQTGYLFIYVVNESGQNANVYFDDLKITHSSATSSFRVSQVNEYYPFGLPTANSWRAEGYIDPGLLYQSAFAVYDSLTGYYDFLSRSYDPVLGRFFAVDPAGQFSSPYLGMGNVPHMGVDPDGAFWGLDLMVNLAINLFGNTAQNAAQAGVNSLNGNGTFAQNFNAMGFGTGFSYNSGSGFGYNTSNGYGGFNNSQASNNSIFTGLALPDWVVGDKWNDIEYGWFIPGIPNPNVEQGGYIWAGAEPVPDLREALLSLDAINETCPTCPSGAISTSTAYDLGFAGFVVAGKGVKNVLSAEIVRQGYINNRAAGIQGPVQPGISVPKSLKFIGKFGGTAFSAWSAYDIQDQYRNGEINQYWRNAEQTANFFGALPVIGTGVTIGWETGRWITQRRWYQRAFHGKYYPPTISDCITCPK